MKARWALILLYVAALAPGFFAPYDPEEQHRDSVFMPPSVAPVRLFVEGPEYLVAGVAPGRLHLAAFDRPAFPLGTDGLGRDQLSRLLHGAQISLYTGLLAALITLAIGAVTGVLAGYFGGWMDGVIMRLTEVFQVLPWLYLLIAVRAALPLHVDPAEAFALTTALIGVIGWARPARMIRGVALGAREKDFVEAARGFGAGEWYILRRHILPQAYGVARTQAALLIPQYILAEVALSFLGLGVAEPVPSLGAMLAPLREYHVMASYWWMFAPSLALIPLSIIVDKSK
ncbi:MAG: ABC transporter permease [Acidobacteria bacterium]|nr:ABC transporter permease [Acidobacteriota bacterium]